ncbi:MAG: DUF1127 domain-containing protein [Pseudomonas sp.]|uniref:DUF1127 domain-containing protein n=1 Tax=Pseudomonas sp. TaxID=306 RepID=UPI0033920399
MNGQHAVLGFTRRKSIDLVSHWWAKVRRWNELARQRRQLLRLNEAALKDLGLSRADVEHEVEQPFWHDPMNNR